ncbi:MAG: hypothetical protein P8M30_04695 [Planctomycetaceae bacterium]|nr:hypothetical protein [Planctomycetaceae bacterium]
MQARIAVIVVAGCLSACSGIETCEELEFYEYAEAGKRIEAPDDLDNLAADRELTIPDVSPRSPRDRSAGCMDRPPTLRIERPGDDEES